MRSFLLQADDAFFYRRGRVRVRWSRSFCSRTGFGRNCRDGLFFRFSEYFSVTTLGIHFAPWFVDAKQMPVFVHPHFLLKGEPHTRPCFHLA